MNRRFSMSSAAKFAGALTCALAAVGAPGPGTAAQPPLPAAAPGLSETQPVPAKTDASGSEGTGAKALTGKADAKGLRWQFRALSDPQKGAKGQIVLSIPETDA